MDSVGFGALSAGESLIIEAEEPAHKWFSALSGPLHLSLEGSPVVGPREELSRMRRRNRP